VIGEAEGDDGAFREGIGTFDAETPFRDIGSHPGGIAGGTVGRGPGELDAITQGDAGRPAKAIHFLRKRSAGGGKNFRRAKKRS